MLSSFGLLFSSHCRLSLCSLTIPDRQLNTYKSHNNITDTWCFTQLVIVLDQNGQKNQKVASCYLSNKTDISSIHKKTTKQAGKQTKQQTMMNMVVWFLKGLLTVPASSQACLSRVAAQLPNVCGRETRSTLQRIGTFGIQLQQYCFGTMVNWYNYMPKLYAYFTMILQNKSYISGSRVKAHAFGCDTQSLHKI